MRRAGGAPGPYALQGAIAAVHGLSPSWTATDWDEIVGLYDLLVAAQPTPVVRLNRAVAVAERDGAAAGLAEIDALDELAAFHLWHASRAELLRRLDRDDEAVGAYEAALACRPNDTERRFLERRMADLASTGGGRGAGSPQLGSSGVSSRPNSARQRDRGRRRHVDRVDPGRHRDPHPCGRRTPAPRS